MKWVWVLLCYSHSLKVNSIKIGVVPHLRRSGSCLKYFFVVACETVTWSRLSYLVIVEYSCIKIAIHLMDPLNFWHLGGTLSNQPRIRGFLVINQSVHKRLLSAIILYYILNCYMASWTYHFVVINLYLEPKTVSNVKLENFFFCLFPNDSKLRFIDFCFFLRKESSVQAEIECMYSSVIRSRKEDEKYRVIAAN